MAWWVLNTRVQPGRLKAAKFVKERSMAKSQVCSVCAQKRGKQVPGNCSECSNGTRRAMVTLCPTCATKNGKPRCEVCKTDLSSGTPATTRKVEFGCGPTGFCGC